MNDIYETDLKFTPIINKFFISKKTLPITIVSSIFFSCTFLGYVYYDYGYIDKEITFLSISTSILIGFLFALLCTLKEIIDLQRQKKILHNKNIEYVQNFTNNIILNSELKTPSKVITIFHKDAELMSLKHLDNESRILFGYMKAPDKKREIFYEDKFAINTDNSTLGYLSYEINEETGEEKYNFNTAKFSEVLDFELVDKTTSTQISLAKSSSNRSDAMAGAVVSEFLFNDAATGAIIGASGEVTTETVTQTLKDELYQINIQLDNIQNPIIRIETKNRETVSQVIAMLKIILNKNKAKEC